MDGPLCGLRNARHSLNYLHRVKAHGSFGAEHYRIGSVHNGIGHVVDLCARGRQAFNHGFHHLGSHDYRFAELNGLAHNHFLNQRHGLHWNLNPQVSAGNHGPVGGC